MDYCKLFGYLGTSKHNATLFAKVIPRKLAIREPCAMQLNALDRSVDTAPTTKFSSRFFYVTTRVGY